MSMWSVSSEASTAKTTSKSNGSQEEKANTRRLSVEDEMYVKDLLKAFGSNTKVDLAAARKNALTDTKASVEALFNQYKETALPQIMSAQQKTGGYGSTTATALSNDAFARTVANAGALQLQAVGQYETNALNRSQQALSGLSTSLQALLQANETSTAESAFKSSARSTTTAVKIAGSYGK